ncbi:MAG: NAD(P)-dependent glycerol-3-phosphate dehydrogenase [Candidatus Aminicenantes bacterium]|nr:NAD(P)-dependent glycerol-3-phosphate dehydrogenase [Candidatus Aminicenantes bacterium]
MDNILVVGGGSWGTAFADYLARNGNQVKLWVWEKDVIQFILNKRENAVFLPGIELSVNLQPVADLEGEAGRADMIIMAVPSKFIRAVMQRINKVRPPGQTLLNLSKGFESESLKTISEVAHEVFGPDIAPCWVTVSGPSFARELACQHPTAVVAASANEALLIKIQNDFSSNVLRIYRTADLKGLEVAGSLKNVMAIAAGMINGLGFGVNTTAALVTRANMEISRLGIRLGARAETFWGLGGIGDLMLTCFGSLSRNFQLGRKIAQGVSLATAEKSTPMVAEGVETTKAVNQLARELDIDMPISRSVYQVLFDGQDVKKALIDLMQRSLKNEWNIN